MNVYVQALATDKVWTTLGPKIARALCGITSGGAALRSHFDKCMESLGYESCKAGLDKWLKPEVRQEDGVQYYSYLLCYVDDILCFHHNADNVIQWLHKFFPLKLRFGHTCT